MDTFHLRLQGAEVVTFGNEHTSTYTIPLEVDEKLPQVIRTTSRTIA